MKNKWKDSPISLDNRNSSIKNRRKDRYTMTNSKERGTHKKPILRIVLNYGLFALAIIVIVNTIIGEINRRSRISSYGNMIGTVTNRAIDSSTHAVNQSVENSPVNAKETDEFRIVDSNDHGLNYFLDCRLEYLAKTSFSPAPAYELEGRSYEFIQLSEKHDHYERYIVKIAYKISNGQKWEYQSGYMYSRYSPTKETWFLLINLDRKPDQTFLSAVNWEMDTPYDVDYSNFLSYVKETDASYFDGYLRYKGVATSTVKSQNINENVNAENEDSFYYEVYNRFFDGMDILGYLSFNYGGYTFELSVNKLEDGRMIVEGGCWNNLGESYSFCLDQELFIIGAVLVDNSESQSASGSYISSNPSDLLILLDSTGDGQTDVEIEYNALTCELSGGLWPQARHLLTVINWNNTPISYPPD